jgi:ribosomal protein S27E
MTEPLGQSVVNLDIRPLRAAYMVPHRNGAAFSRAVLIACDRWGGLQEPIVPVSPRGRIRPLWKQLLEIAHPDVMVDIAGLADPVRARLASEFAVQIFSARQFEEWGDRIHPLGVHSADEVRSLGVVMPKSRRAALLAATGAIPDSDEIDEWRELGARVTVSDDLSALAAAQLSGQTVLATSVHKCGEILVEGWGGGMGMVWVAPSTSLRDALYFWNFRARMTQRLMPGFAVMVDPKAALSEAFVDALRRRTAARTGEIAPAFTLCSLSVGDGVLRELISKWGFSEQTDNTIHQSFGKLKPEDERHVTVAVNWRPFIPTGRRVEGIRQPVLAQLFRPRTKLLLPSPIAFNPQIGGNVRLRISGSLEFALPRSKAAVQLVDQQALPADEGFELNSFARQLYELDVNVPTRQEVLTAMLGERHITYQLNQKGRHTLGVIRLAPDPQLFANTSTEAVVTALTGARSKHLAVELAKRLKGVSEEERHEMAALFAEERLRSFLTLEHIAGRAKLVAGAALAELDRLIQHLMAERGLVVKCNECGMRSFVRLDQSREPITCPACSSSAAYQSDKSGEPQMHYRLNSLLETASGQGIVPHMFGIAGLMRRDPQTYVLPASDVFKNGKPLGEADLVCLSSSEVLVGEAKRTRAWFSGRQIRRDVQLAIEMGATTYVMVCMEPLGAELDQMALQIATKRGLSLLAIDGPQGDARTIIAPPVSAAPARLETA